MGVKVVVVATGVLALSAAVLLQAAGAGRARDASERNRPRAVLDADYVSSAECKSCHPQQYDSWFSSYHRRMTQLATPDSVIGEFDGRDLDGYRISRVGDRYFVDVPALRSGEQPARRPISLVTGSHHMQVYWFETGENRALGQLPFGYLKADRRWVPRASMFLEPPGDARPSEIGRWNSSCIACHTTHGRPRADLHGAYDSAVAEFGIACEACHGPGREHVDNFGSPLSRYARHLGAPAASGIVHPQKLDHRKASEICSQCHALWQHRGAQGEAAWNDHGGSYRPGGDPAESMWLLQPSAAKDDARVAWVMKNRRSYADGQFWRDGQARVSGREFSGMIDSPCYQRGELSCLSCHSMHKPADDPRPTAEWANDQLRPGMDGDQACLQCHTQYRGRVTQHTFHAENSPGSRCYNCHMPNTSYGLMKAMRTHRIDVPDARATVDAGRPNACNACHLDRSLGWAAEQLQARYGIAPPELDADQREVQAGWLLALRGDAGQRALIAWAAGWAPAASASPRADLPALLGVLMDDPYDAVRYVAERSLRALPGVDTAQLDYDFVQPPERRAPVAARVAELARAKPEDRERTAAWTARLLPLRDQRPVLLLE
ncbi:MAG TPA: multiheme c-type cytochrome [Polyangiales bacterium]|nr:multiheme c-type cytochrome [Polyangiales bacterium]